MGVLKGTDNFMASRNEAIKRNQIFIAETLEVINRKKLIFRDLSALIHYVSKETGIHRTTLKRNHVYHKLLLTHLAHQKGSLTNIHDDASTLELLKAKNLTLKMELESFKKEANSLRKVISSNNQTPATSTLSSGKAFKGTDWYIAFCDTASLLLSVIERVNRFGVTIQLDMKGEKVLDLAALNNDMLITEKSKSRHLFDYINKVNTKIS